MFLNEQIVKEFTDDTELRTFCKDYWGDYIKTLDETVICKLISIQSHGLNEGRWNDDAIIEEFQKTIWCFPPVPYDIMVYREGKLIINGRPFISASFYRKTAEHFANNQKGNLHKIILRKGARIVPSLWLAEIKTFSEKEIIMAVSCLHKRIGYYEYY